MSPRPMKTTEYDALRDLPGVLDLAAFERVADSVFRPVGLTPPWLPLAADCPVDLAERFAMLEFFLPDFEAAWVPDASPVTSDIWTESGGEGDELYLQATAVCLRGRCFLVLRSLPKRLQESQQRGNDNELAEERVRRYKDIAERANRAKTDFLNNMSHEIRTPLNAVIGLADVLASTPLTTDQRKCVEVTQRNGIALLTLINEILDLSKVESGKVELESTDMDLRDVIDHALEVVDARATAKGLALRSDIAPGVPFYLIGDPNRLRQVIINLLGNSIKFTESGGLHVTVEPNPEDGRPGCLRFAVHDTGIGIAPDKLSAVFESFTQADSSTTRKYGGTGLGLTISKQLVELMNGRIWVESTLGVGSTFFFTAQLGVQADQTERRAAPHQAGVAHAPDKDLERLVAGLRILLADDSDDNRFLILSYLRGTQAAVEIAENGQIAVELFRAKHFDVVLMDVEMPVMDGYTATREIRRLEHERGAARTPVLALTAHAFADMAAKGIEAGFTAMLTKPIRKTTLLEALVPYAPVGRALPPARVLVEEGMEDAVPAYLDKRRAEIPVYRQALAAGNFEAIRGLAHKTKGTGAGYGFPVLTELCGTLEKAAERREAIDCGLKIEALAHYLGNVELEYSK